MKNRFEVVLSPYKSYRHNKGKEVAAITTNDIIMIDNKHVYGEVVFKDVALADAVARLLNEKISSKAG